MDSATGYSAAYAVPSTDMPHAILALESAWLSQFWPPEALHGDGAFQNADFKSYTSRHGIALRPMPPRRHQKNACDPRHRIIRSIFLRLRQADPALPVAVSAIQAVRTSNDLYGNDVASAFELAKGFTRPVLPNVDFTPLTAEIHQAHLDIAARRKLNLILRSHSHMQNRLRIGNLVQIYIKNASDKRGKWTSPRQITEINSDGGFITVPGRAGKLVRAAFEDVRVEHRAGTLDGFLQSAIDELDDEIDDMLSDLVPANADSGEHQLVDDDSDGHASNAETAVEYEQQPQHPLHSPSDAEFSDDMPLRPDLGARIQVYWPLDDTFYSGAVSDIDDNGLCTVKYDDKQEEQLDMAQETWRYINTVLASTANISPTLASSEQTVQRDMMETLGQRPFLYYHAQGFEQAVMIKAYKKEEDQYMRHVKVVPRSKVPPDANTISSHVVYKIKVKDDDELKLKARISPHGNEDSYTTKLRADCAMCPPLVIRIVLSVSVARKWNIARIDVETAFHQTGPAAIQVYVRPSRESQRKGELWLLLVAGYGLINAGAKWQRVSDDAFHDIGLSAIHVIPQLFGHFKEGDLLLLVIKIVDDVLLTGPDEWIDWFETHFARFFKLSESERGPVSFASLDYLLYKKTTTLATYTPTTSSTRSSHICFPEFADAKRATR